MISEAGLMEISEIMDSFNIEEITSMIKKQLGFDTNDVDVFSDIKVDHFKPLYYKYSKLTKYDLDENTAQEADEKFINICKTFLEQIFLRFNLTINEDWYDNNQHNIIALTLAVYDFFVINFESNLFEVLFNYIIKNKDAIYKTFEDMKNKKDASSISNKKIFTPEMALIVSNIYNINTWILSYINEDDFLNYMNDLYVPMIIIKKLYESGELTGEFISAIADIFTNSPSLMSSIGFKFISMVKHGEIKDLFKVIE